MARGVITPAVSGEISPVATDEIICLGWLHDGVVFVLKRQIRVRYGGKIRWKDMVAR